MISLSLREAATILGSQTGDGDVVFHGCSTDTRTLKPGELFFALTGPNFDGSDFVSQAAALGAAAVVVQSPVQISEQIPGEGTIPCLLVDDTRVALGQLAHAWRARFELPVVAVTGSNGKTTVKEMLASILSVSAETLSTQGNLNNDIGVPLTLFRLHAGHQYAVIEMGANRPGDIKTLCEIAGPSVGIVTQCAPAHLEGFGSIENVAAAKAEMFAGLSEGGTAILNCDDRFAQLWRDVIGDNQCLSFGLSTDAEVTVSGIEAEHGASYFRLHVPSGSEDIRLALPGLHNIMNALAAAAAAEALGIAVADSHQGLDKIRTIQGRLEMKPGLRGCRLIDDTYNANIDSMKAALAVLAQQTGEHWLVMGDMGELGRYAVDLHRDIGQLAREVGVSRLFAIGELSRHAVDEFGGEGCLFESKPELVETLTHSLHDDLTVLVKGSRSACMETIVNSLSVGA